MKHVGRWIWLFVLLLLWPLGCSQGRAPAPASPQTPMVRVRVLENQEQLMVSATESPVVRAESDQAPRRLNFPKGAAVPVVFSPAGWQVGNVSFGTGELTIIPATEGSVSINGQSYRGRYRLVPLSAGTFDVVNDVDIESYLKGVLARELFPNWHDEAYKAQAIAARTYALYVARTAGVGRSWDLHADVRSQVYGGIAAESNKSRSATLATAGIVLAYGPDGQERIFKAYYSSCCGGISQSAADAFGDPYIEPLSDQNVQGMCSVAPNFTWGPVIVPKEELTRRIRLWGQRRDRPEKDMATVARIEIQATNRWGRPTRYIVTDTTGTRYSLGPEEIRWAVNTDAPSAANGPQTTLRSGFFKLINDPDAIRFVEGHGRGHGVGLCQWCTQRRAELGMRHEDIVLAAYQRARLVRAY